MRLVFLSSMSLELHRLHSAVNEPNDRAELPGPFFQQKLDGAIAEIARILGIERNRIGAAQLVAKILADESHVEARTGSV